MSTDNQAVVCLNLGNDYVKSQQWELAANCYRQAIEADPNLAAAYTSLGSIWQHWQQPLSSAKQLYQQISENPGSVPVDFCLLLGESFEKHGDNQGAIASYNLAIAINPKLAIAHYKIAQIYHNINQVDLAIGSYQKAIELQPNIYIYYVGLGQALSSQKQDEQAITAYRKAIELKPDFCWSYHHLAVILTRLGRVEEAIAAYRQEITLNPDFYWSHFHLGDLLSQQNQPEEAIEAYRQAIAINPQQPEAHQRLTEILSRHQKTGEDALLTGRYEEAIAIYRDMVAARPDYSWGYYGLGLALLNQRQWREAIDVFNQAISINPDCFWSYNHLGYCLFKQGKISPAIDAYKQAIAIDPEIPEVYIRLGDALLQQPDIDGAIAAYLDAIKAQPEAEIAYLKLRHLRTYSFIKLQPEQIEAIASSYQQAISQVPHYPEPYINYGDLLTEIGQISEAISTYKQGVLAKTKICRPEFFSNHWETASVQGPNFIIIGAQKAGTTSLYEYLCHHPQVIPNLHKEVDFFIWQYYRGLDWYLAHFPPIPPGGEFLTGEASPSYIVDSKVCDRLYQAFPKVKLIVTLRNPVDRAFSQYQDHRNWMGQEKRTLQQAMIDEIAILDTIDDPTLAGRKFWGCQYGYLLRGMYVYFLEKWMQKFPPEQLLIISSEQLYTQPQNTLKQVFEFLGLPDHQLSEYPRYTAGSYNPIPETLHQTLGDFFRPHNHKLEELLGKKFHWSP
ncbi:tetratricopeptide repeat protein [Arthrospira platensis NCB002]|uniref:TPR domain protein n=1 Tax=Limnospira platensis NIES-46 TaxID=1236695 RepID=A0A5M3T9W8_LIMPL|nr:tetratricopeptide repeat protein [Arthrospira platensis]MDF2211001.1 tetratricopeptide repeat protein [Arthrospira platensis NCB002]BAI88951.1 TPR domain protein [Arthrospira platensis NIES-39]BDT11356.1 TPR domain protein [Arthrospira platensis NIES-39]GCE94189.1 TPR domain protein [Arthrospira platensis NIES-46]